MLDWLKRHIKGPAQSLVGLADNVYDAVKGVWQRIEDIAHALRRGWNALLPAISVFGGWLGEAFEYLRVAGIWTVDKIVPAWARWALNAAVTLARTLVNGAIGLARGLVSNLSRWATSAINTLTSWARSAVGWLTDRLNEVRNWVSKAGSWLWDVVSRPEQLAAWVAPHLMRPITQFIIGQAGAIGRWVLARSVAAALASARIVESVIVRIL